MRITTAVISLLVSVCGAAQQASSPVLACNMKAISAAERPRYNALVKRLRTAVRERRELADGYQLRLDGKAISLPETAEWISMERLCCPFLTLQIEVSGAQGNWILRLTGPAGVKAFLAAEL